MGEPLERGPARDERVAIAAPAGDGEPRLQHAPDRGVALAIGAHLVDDLARRTVVQLAPPELRAVGEEARVAAAAQTAGDARDRLQPRARGAGHAQAVLRARLVGGERAANVGEAPREEAPVERDEQHEQPLDQTHPTSSPDSTSSSAHGSSQPRSQPPTSHHCASHDGSLSHAFCARVRRSISGSTRRATGSGAGSITAGSCCSISITMCR